MILEKYDYRYALIPHSEAKKMGLGWRKADPHGMVMMNLSELKQMPGEGSLEEKVEAAGGHLLNPDEAYYYRHTNTFSFVEYDAAENPEDGTGAPESGETEEIDPGFTQGGTQTEFPPETGDTEETDPGFSQETAPEVSPEEQGQEQNPETASGEETEIKNFKKEEQL